VKLALNHLPDDPRGPAAAALRAQGFAVIAAPGDVSKPDTAERMVQTRSERSAGRLLVNNAGTRPPPSRSRWPSSTG
jgi:NAD(P)-dependent dehydrogenase (short-subunit alcohol dehydrogenase family)